MGEHSYYGPCYRIKATITFNPSRIRQYQPEGGSPNVVLFAERRPAQDEGEFALDGEDNVITQEETGQYRDEDAWIDEVARYARAIDDLLEETFSSLFYPSDGSTQATVRPGKCDQRHVS